MWTYPSRGLCFERSMALVRLIVLRLGLPCPSLRQAVCSDLEELGPIELQGCEGWQKEQVQRSGVNRLEFMLPFDTLSYLFGVGGRRDTEKVSFRARPGLKRACGSQFRNVLAGS